MADRSSVFSRIWLAGVAATLAVGALFTLLAQATQAQTELNSPINGLLVVESSATHLVLDLTVPTYTLTEAQWARDSYQRLTVAGATFTAPPGQPELPVFSALVGIPAQGNVSVRIMDDAVETVAGHYRLPPGAEAVSNGDLQPGTIRYVPDVAAYASAQFYPAEIARVAATAWLRDQHLARVDVYPFQYEARTGTLRWHRHLRIEITFAGAGTPDRLVAAPMDSSPFEQTLRGSLINYEMARQWRSQKAVPAAMSSFASAAPRYKIVVDHDGLYRITYADLTAAGLDLASLDPRNLRLSNQGLDVAIDIVGENDGHFDPGDYILFYGQRLRGDLLASKHTDEASDWLNLQGWQPQFNAKMVEKYTDANVYWLDIGATPGLRMPTINGTPGTAPAADYYTATVHAEQSRLWKTTHFNSEDTWFWDEIITGFAGQFITRTYTTTLSAIANAPLSATVRAELTTITPNPPPNPTYRTIFRLNNVNQILEDTVWTGLVRHRLEAAAPLTSLAEGSNALSLTVVAQTQTPNADLFFDWFEIQYPRRFQAENNQLTFSDQRSGPRQYAASGFTTSTLQVLNVSNPWQPQRVLSSSVAAAAGQYTATFAITSSVPVTYFVGGADQLQSPRQISRYDPPDLGSSNGADYLIITHRDFITSLQTLAAYRAAEGLRVKIIDVDDVYNQFNDGLYHPIAIKNFLKYAYANWQPPAPTYVLLVGDGHWNFKNFNPAQYGTPPNFMPPNLAWVDPYQGEVDSANELVELVGNDPLPDMLVGRLPVNTAAEADVVVGKIISYETQAKAQPYLQRMMFVADNVPDPKGAGDFIQLSDDLIQEILPATYQPDRLYANNYSCLPGAGSCPQVNYAITSTLNQTGALFVNYIGHASLNRWGDESFLVNANVASLNNLARLPIFLSMTCLDGYWLYPSITGSNNGLMETMLRAANGGSVASFSPTGLGVATGHDTLERALLNAVFRQGTSRLGSAALAGKLGLYASGGDYDLINTFTIFGDPALHLPTHDLVLNPASASQMAARGSTIQYTVRITNTALLTDNVALKLIANWPVTVAPTSVALQPGSSALLVVSVTVPYTANVGETGIVTVTAQSLDASTRPQAQLNTMTVGALYKTFLPLVRRD